MTHILEHDLTDYELKKPIPEHWKVWPDGAIVAQLPCGHVNELEDHWIDADGTLHPSVICPSGDWHGEVRLSDWDTDFRVGWPQSRQDRDRAKIR